MWLPKAGGGADAFIDESQAKAPLPYRCLTAGFLLKAVASHLNLPFELSALSPCFTEFAL